MLTFGSLFAGIGGFDLGFERAGMECKWQVEIDPFCQKVLAKHWPNMERFGDVRECGQHNLQPVDVICGGFPCQDVSVAGRRAGLAGERSGLWFEFARLVAELGPRWVVVENVPGLLSSNRGEDFATILRGLVKLGYGVGWRVCDAQYFGVAQRRRRVLVVGSLGNGRASQVLFESSSVCRNSAPSRETGQDLTPLLEVGARTSGDGYRDGNGIGQAGDPMFTLQAGKQHGVAGTLGGSSQSGGFRTTDLDNNGAFVIAATLSSGQARSPGVNAPGRRREDDINLVFQPRYYTRDNKTGGAPGETAEISNCHKAGDSAPVVYRPHHAEHEGRGVDFTKADVVHGLRQPNGTDNALILGISENQRAEVRLTEISRQIRSGGGKPGQGYPAAMMGSTIRRLMPVECERLQGFPDGHTAGQSDSARYRQLGNAVCVPVAEWIGRRIVAIAEQHP